MPKQPTRKMNNGLEIPILGLGTYGLRGKDGIKAVQYALDAGYRHIDTAALYDNEREVGTAIRESGIPRKEIFVTTKIFPTGFFNPRKAFESSLQRLGLDYVDLYLIHWPAPGRGKVWKSLEKIYEENLARSIGVSNYSIGQLEELKREANVPPVVNQVEFHPFHQVPDILAYCEQNNIIFESYTPLTRGKRLSDPVIIEMAKKYSRSPAQVVLRWEVQHGAIVIPRSSNKDRIIQNSKIFDFELEPKDMIVFDSIARNPYVKAGKKQKLHERA